MSKPEIKSIAEQLSTSSKQAVKSYAPIVDELIQNKSQDEQHIERTLDGLLDFCFEDEALELYKKVCRYYFDINPQATVEYINYYRDMYEEESALQ